MKYSQWCRKVKNFGWASGNGGHNLPTPGWNRVNWSAKYWGGPVAPPAPQYRHHCNSTWKLQAPKMLCKLFLLWHYVHCTQHIMTLQFSCTDLVIQWTSYCGLVDAKRRASDKDLPVISNKIKKEASFWITILTYSLGSKVYPISSRPFVYT